MIHPGSVAVLAAALCCASCQYEGYRPDVTFGDMNDRFDIGAVVRSVQGPPARYPSDTDQDSRRHLDPLTTKLLLHHLRKNARRRSWRRNNTFPQLTSQSARRILFEDLFPATRRIGELQDVKDVQGSDHDEVIYKKPKNTAFKQNMQKFVEMLHDDPAATRRMADGEAERDVLLHYGFPFHVKIRGFLGPRYIKEIS